MTAWGRFAWKESGGGPIYSTCIALAGFGSPPGVRLWLSARVSAAPAGTESHGTQAFQPPGRGPAIARDGLRPS